VKQAPSRSKVPVWLLLAAIVGASAIIWALVPTSSKRQQADSEGETSEATAASPSAQAADLSRLRRAIEVLSRAHADPGGSERRVAMNDLLSQGDSPTKLTMLLEAAAADPSPPDKDPLWPELVRGLSAIWQGESIATGMDLMFTESRPRARDAVVSSFAKLALERTGELTPPQQQKLSEYFIDLHSRLPAYQKREVEAAARKIAGNDVADLLQGKSADNLEIHREHEQAIQAVQENQKRVASQ
jgi:hypothetical protein